MPHWLSILLGFVAGLLVVVGAIWFGFHSKDKRRKRKSWLANSLGREEQTWDVGDKLPPGRGGTLSDIIDGD